MPSGGGFQGAVFLATNPSGTPFRGYRSLAVKLYYSDIPLAFAQEQYALLQELHGLLDGHKFGGWAIDAPTPLWISEDPAALIMTAATGNSMLQHLERGTLASASRIESVAHAIVSAMAIPWSRHERHGDLRLDNILCDIRHNSLCFVDPGVPPWAPITAAERLFSTPAHDLAQMLYESVATTRRSLGRIGAERRKQTCTMAVLHAALDAIPSMPAKYRLLQEVDARSQHLLDLLQVSFTPKGGWRAALRLMAGLRIDAMIAALRSDLSVSEAAPAPGMDPPARCGPKL